MRGSIRLRHKRGCPANVNGKRGCAAAIRPSADASLGRQADPGSSDPTALTIS